MKLDAENVLNRPCKPWSKVTPPTANLGQIAWDIDRALAKHEKHQAYWLEKNHSPIPPQIFKNHTKLWLEIGAGTGHFFVELARLNPNSHLIAIERCKLRGRRLVKKITKSGLTNINAFRGNAIPALITAIPVASLDRIYIMYPCPWPRNSQRKNRWYLHPVMANLVRILKPGGKLIWASDQKFYIDEATFVCESKFKMKTLSQGPIEPNPYNDLAHFPGGRTKFEAGFLSSGSPCYELISEKL